MNFSSRLKTASLLLVALAMLTACSKDPLFQPTESCQLSHPATYKILGDWRPAKSEYLGDLPAQCVLESTSSKKEVAEGLEQKASADSIVFEVQRVNRAKMEKLMAYEFPATTACLATPKVQIGNEVIGVGCITGAKRQRLAMTVVRDDVQVRLVLRRSAGSVTESESKSLFYFGNYAAKLMKDSPLYS